MLLVVASKPKDFTRGAAVGLWATAEERGAAVALRALSAGAPNFRDYVDACLGGIEDVVDALPPGETQTDSDDGDGGDADGDGAAALLGVALPAFSTPPPPPRGDPRTVLEAFILEYSGGVPVFVREICRHLVSCKAVVVRAGKG